MNFAKRHECDGQSGYNILKTYRNGQESSTYDPRRLGRGKTG